MFIYPLVSAHFVKVSQCDQESRIAASALAEVVTRLLVSESPGMSFNQTLIGPFQVIFHNGINVYIKSARNIFYRLLPALKTAQKKLKNSFYPL